MNKVIEQVVKFKGATAAELFEILLDPVMHAKLHNGATAKISSREGDKFSLINGNLKGKNLLIVPNRMIVQSWRGTVWNDDDLDSIVTLVFSNTKTGAQIYLSHSCTPMQFKELWKEVYWDPLTKFLAERH